MGPGQAGFRRSFSRDWHVDFALTLKGSWDVPVLNCQLAHSMPLTCVSTRSRKNWGAQLNCLPGAHETNSEGSLGSLFWSKQCSVVLHALP